MAEEGIELGAEESGHILFADHPGGDGCFAALRVLGALRGHSGPVSSVFGGFRPYPRVQRKIPVVERPPLEHLDGLAAWHEEWNARLGPTGRVLLRYSGTEPVLRMLVEGPDASRVVHTADVVESCMRGVLR
jgi:phosphoglucosamine mutase